MSKVCTYSLFADNMSCLCVNMSLFMFVLDDSNVNKFSYISGLMIPFR